MQSIREIYKIGRGPSSSHTMGPEKAAKVFLEKYKNAESYKVILYGSLAKTGKGHHTDLAINSVLGAERTEINVMRFCGRAVPADIERDPPLSEIYAIVGKVFGFEFEPWYLDMSHRIRHGVSRCRRLEGSALVIQHEINGEALISQVATLPGQRGRGFASRLLSAACAELSDSEVFILCEDKLIPFYRNNGFEVCGRLVQLARK